MGKDLSRGKLPARDRILLSAHRLFNQHGMHRTGVDRIISESKVAKMSFYSHFPSKQDLVLQYLRQKDFEWFELLQRHMDRGRTAEERLLRVFESLEEWFRKESFRGCPFVKGLAEFDEEDAEIHSCLTAHFEKTRTVLAELCSGAAPGCASELTDQMVILVIGAIVAAQTSGTPEPAIQARKAADSLLRAVRKK